MSTNINDLMFAEANKENAMGQTISGVDNGSVGRLAGVNARRELLTTTGTPFQQACFAGDAYYWLSASADIDAGDTMLLVRNDSQRLMVVEAITIVNGNVAACTYDIHVVTNSFTAVGTAVTGWNMRSDKPDAGGLVTAMADETGNVQGRVIQDHIFTVASIWDVLTQKDVPALGALTIGSGHAIAVDQITESTAGQVAITAYFIDK